MNRVKAAFFSFTALRPGEHASHVEWHQMDHMPEQYAIPGLVWGQRYVSTPVCNDNRLLAVGDVADCQYLIVYFFTDPVNESIVEFQDLADRLRALGRMHDSQGKLRATMTQLEQHAAARVQILPSVIPYRPHRAVYAIVEEPIGDLTTWLPRQHEHDIPAILELPGVAGLWTFATTKAHYGRTYTPGDFRCTLVYLDEPVGYAVPKLNEFLRNRWNDDAPVKPVFAGAFETTRYFDWDQYERG